MVPVAALNAALTRVETRDVDMHVTADEGRVERNNCMLITLLKPLVLVTFSYFSRRFCYRRLMT